ncbi:hypothetical protein QYF36_000738 [Acer negundo]|nr:hypothetical protein QYF36_000738 [Acer negundo]
MIPINILSKLGVFEVEFEGCKIKVNVIDNAALIDRNIVKLKSSLRKPVVGFDVKFGTDHHDQKNAEIAKLLILCVKTHCLIIQLNNLVSVPDGLKDFLSDGSICFMRRSSLQFLKLYFVIVLGSRYLASLTWGEYLRDIQPVRRPNPLGPAFSSSAYSSRLTGFALPWALQGSGSSPRPVCTGWPNPSRTLASSRTHSPSGTNPPPAMPEVRGVTNFPPLKSCTPSCKCAFNRVLSQDNTHPIFTPCLLVGLKRLASARIPCLLVGLKCLANART